MSGITLELGETMAAPIALDELFSETEVVEAGRSLREVRSAVPVKIQDFPSGGSDLTVYADTIYIDGVFMAPGRAVKLVAREIRCQGSTIDVSGAAPALDFKAGEKKPTPSIPGVTGSDGDNGADGQPAGSIEIIAAVITGDLTLLAHGGTGGRGQDGGDGSIGQGGPEPGETPCRTTGDNRGFKGSTGGQGGAAGKAGSPGRGGNGGKLTVYSFSPQAKISIDVLHGDAGAAAAHGKPGEGGPGGLGSLDLIGTNHRETDYFALIERPTLNFAQQALARNWLSEDKQDQLPNEAAIFEMAEPLEIDEEAGRRLSRSMAEFALVHPFEIHEPHHEPGRTVLRCEVNGWHSRGPLGDSGPQGAWQPLPPATNVPGSDGTSTLVLDRLPPTLIAYDRSFFRLLQLAAEESYRSGSLERAVPLLKYLADATSPDAVAKASTLRSDLGIVAFEKAELEDIGAFYIRASNLIQQMGTGLDFYGRSRDFIPLLNPDAYDGVINGLLDCGAVIEELLSRYKSATKNAVVQRDSLSAIIDQVGILEQRGDDEFRALSREIAALDAEVSALVATAEIQKVEIAGAQQVLKDAIQHMGDGCSFVEIIAIVGTAIALATAAYAAVGALQAALAAYDAAKTFSDTVAAIKKMEVVGSDIKDAAEAWKKIKGLVAASPEAAKLAFLEKDYDQHLADAMAALDKINLVEARDLKVRLKGFSETNKTKNAKAVEITSRLLRRQQISAELGQRGKERDAAREAIARSADPTLPLISAFAEGSYREIRSAAAELIILESRAYEYWALAARDAPVHGWTIASLRTAHVLLKADIALERSRRLSGPGRLTQGESVSIRQLVSPATYKRFIEGAQITAPDKTTERVHQLAFALTPENAPRVWRWAAFGATGLRVRLHGVHTTAGTVQYSLLHSGSVIVRSTRDEKLRFVHPSRRYTLAYEQKTGTSLSDEQVIAADHDTLALSPFTTWTLIVRESSNPGLNLAQVDRVELSLIGSYLS